MQKSQIKLMGAVAAVAIVAGAGVGAWSVLGNDSAGTVVVTAEAAAQTDRSPVLPATGGTIDASLDESIATSCLVAEGPNTQSAQDQELANADTEALAALLTKYGIEHEVVTESNGFTHVMADQSDIVTASVVSSFWEDRYPPAELSVEDLDEVVTEGAPVEDFDEFGDCIDGDDIIPFEELPQPLGEDGVAIVEPVVESADESIEAPISVEEMPADVDGELPEGMELHVAPPIDIEAEEAAVAKRDAEAAAMMSGFEAAGVTARVDGESSWQIVLFDVNNDAATDVITSVLAARN